MIEEFLASFLTVVGGVLVFVVGQGLVSLYVERIQAQAKLVEEIAVALTFYARRYTSIGADLSSLPEDVRQRLLTESEQMRTLSARLRASADTFRCYGIFEGLRLVLPRKDVISASGELTLISNVMPCPDSDSLRAAVDSAKKTRRLLRIGEVPETPKNNKK